jgi:hypothetical protein
MRHGPRREHRQRRHPPVRLDLHHTVATGVGDHVTTRAGRDRVDVAVDHVAGRVVGALVGAEVDDHLPLAVRRGPHQRGERRTRRQLVPDRRIGTEAYGDEQLVALERHVLRPDGAAAVLAGDRGQTLDHPALLTLPHPRDRAILTSAHHIALGSGDAGPLATGARLGDVERTVGPEAQDPRRVQPNATSVMAGCAPAGPPAATGTNPAASVPNNAFRTFVFFLPPMEEAPAPAFERRTSSHNRPPYRPGIRFINRGEADLRRGVHG